LVHAGDMTDHSTVEEFQTVLDWIGSLPHKVKVMVAGNRDGTLDRYGGRFSQAALDVLTSRHVIDKGIHYLDREVRTVAYYKDDNGEQQPLKVYGNPVQPEFYGNTYPFTYHPYPHPQATTNWETAPEFLANVQIWVMHSPPRHRLDLTGTPLGLTGCEIEAQKIAGARPQLAVFGHFHFSWGVERIRWEEGGDGVANAEILTLSKERKEKQGLDEPETRSIFDFSGAGNLAKLDARQETLFVNAAWMTGRKRDVEDRNQPIAITVTL